MLGKKPKNKYNREIEPVGVISKTADHINIFFAFSLPISSPKVLYRLKES